MTQVVESTGRYASQFEAFSGNGAGAAPEWLKKLREAAIGRFVELGFPTTRQEEWRFTNVRPITEKSFALARLARSPTVSLQDQDLFLEGGAESIRLVFVNGYFSAGLSSIPSLPSGVRVGSLAAALETDSDLVAEHLGRHASFDEKPFVALNTAFAADGAFVYVPSRTTVEQPVQFLFLATAGDELLMTHPRNLVVLERDASAQVVENYAGVSTGTYLTNAVTEIVVGDNARVDCYRVQRESEQAYHVAATSSHQGRDSWYSLTPVTFGAALSRHDVSMALHGEGGEGTLNGLYVVHGNQHVDHQTVIEHAQPHCDSHEYFNGILDDHSRAVFNGRIIVRPGAQKTDSKQTNNNLLLSDHARADSQPQLEIYADDVKCTHGATLGPLDNNSLFYLQSRGMEAEAARRMLTYGFGVEILDRVAIPEMRDRLEHLVKARLEEDNLRRVAT